MELNERVDTLLDVLPLLDPILNIFLTLKQTVIFFYNFALFKAEKYSLIFQSSPCSIDELDFSLAQRHYFKGVLVEHARRTMLPKGLNLSLNFDRHQYHFPYDALGAFSISEDYRLAGCSDWGPYNQHPIFSPMVLSFIEPDKIMFMCFLDGLPHFISPVQFSSSYEFSYFVYAEHFQRRIDTFNEQAESLILSSNNFGCNLQSSSYNYVHVAKAKAKGPYKRRINNYLKNGYR